MSKIARNHILQGIKDRDEPTIQKLYKRVLPGVKKFILKNSGTEADAEDIFQEALMIIYQKVQKEDLALNCTVPTYIFSVCKNLWLKALRKKGSHGLDRIDQNLTIQSDSNIVEEMNAFEIDKLFHYYFLKLSEKCQQLLSLFFSEKSTQAIMDLTGYTRGYVRKKKFECQKKLLESIEKDPMYKELI